ncbi:MAG: hypothetical protein ACRD4K_08470 [Candidatus Acidiferrales bacterium]
MRTLVRESLVAVLTAGLVVTPAIGAPVSSLGMVVQAQDAQLGAAPAVGGASVYAGDSLQTGASGSMRVRVSAGQVYLLASSAATVTSVEKGISATVNRGTAGFTSTGSEPMEIHADTAILRPNSAATTHAQVTVLGPNDLMVSNYRGALDLEANGEIFSIPENTAYHVILQAPDSGQDQDQSSGPPPKMHGVKSVKGSHTILVLVGAAAIGVGLGYGIYRWTLSPSKP